MNATTTMTFWVIVTIQAATISGFLSGFTYSLTWFSVIFSWMEAGIVFSLLIEASVDDFPRAMRDPYPPPSYFVSSPFCLLSRVDVLMAWSDAFSRDRKGEPYATNLGPLLPVFGESGAAFQMAPTPAGEDGGHKPGHGVLDPHDINNVGFFVLFALIGLGFVVAGIWFFFWARNGGMHFKANDWEDYKSTVLRRKGPNGTLLSGATPSTQLGGGSVYKDVADEDRATTVVTDTTTALSGITAGASDLAAREKRKQKQKQRQKKKSSSSRRVEADGVVADEMAEKSAEKELRNYRHEKPARVGGLNRQPDGVHWGGNGSGTGTGTTKTSSNKDNSSDNRGGIRKVYSTTTTTTASSGTERVRAEARRLREESRSGGSGRRDFSYQRAGGTDSGLSESLLEGAASPSAGGGGGGGSSELGTKSYHHPMPELRERDRRRRERDERRERRAAAAAAGGGGYRREG
ncbi:hypothetical protein CP533_6931 [Ophiocordyceps camponoti-saundersi (nom. inval.)]|nr:hypothetical protein CP533_6931 [Ophiocordyceps camponoti-saundersi (nom. inval.)]